MVVLLIVLNQSCTSPDEPEPPTPIKTDYSWTLDTLRPDGIGQFIFRDIFGTSAGVVLATAHSSLAGRGMLWKLTDNGWTEIPVAEKYGGQLPGVIGSLYSLDGADGENVWICGERIRYGKNQEVIPYGFLAKYDGQNLTEVDLYNEPVVFSLKVMGDDNVYFGGGGPHLYQYQSGEVTKIPLPIEILDEAGTQPITKYTISGIGGKSGAIIVSVLVSFQDGRTGYMQLLLDSSEKWILENHDSGPDQGKGGGFRGYWTSREGNVYSAGYGVFLRTNGDWEKIHQPLSIVRQVFGVSDRDLWAVCNLNMIEQYADGERIQHVMRLPDPRKYLDWTNGWTDGEKVVVVGIPHDNLSMGIYAVGNEGSTETGQANK